MKHITVTRDLPRFVISVIPSSLLTYKAYDRFFMFMSEKLTVRVEFDKLLALIINYDSKLKSLKGLIN